MNLNIESLSQALDLPIPTVERWVRQGRIPVKKRGISYIFSKTVIEKWARKHHLPFVLPQSSQAAAADETAETLVTALENGDIFHNIAGDSVHSVLLDAVERITFMEQDQKECLYDQLLERERLTSTGIGHGIAIPHPRSPISGTIAQPAIVTCFLDQSIDYRALDDKPVFVLFILISPSVKQHLQLLSRLSFCLRNESFIRFLKEKPPASLLFKEIANVEKELDVGEK